MAKTKDELENELEGTQAMLKATEEELARVRASLVDCAHTVLECSDQLKQMPNFEYLLKHGLQMDYDMRTLSYRAPISQFVVQNHRQTVYVEGRGTIPTETLYGAVQEALESFYGNPNPSPG